MPQNVPSAVLPVVSYVNLNLPGVPPIRRTRVPVLFAVVQVAVRQRPISAVGARKAASYGFLDDVFVRLFGEVG